MDTRAKGQAKSVAMQAVVTRADGTVEVLGTVAYWHRNPLRRAWWALAQWCRRVQKNLRR